MREWGWRAFLALTPIAATAHFVVPGRASMVVFTADVALSCSRWCAGWCCTAPPIGGPGTC
jgi:hypothetical protein